jgi:hypothetical protein
MALSVSCLVETGVEAAVVPMLNLDSSLLPARTGQPIEEPRK